MSNSIATEQAAAKPSEAKAGKGKAGNDELTASDSDSSATPSPLASRESSSEDVKSLAKEGKDGNASADISAKPKRRVLTLEERKQIPNSLIVSGILILCLECFGGIWSLDTLKRWYSSMSASSNSTYDALVHLRDLMQAASKGEIDSWTGFAKVMIATIAIGFALFVLFVAPFRAGMWTGQKSKRHRIHRYMGLVYLIQYGAVWVEFVTNYENGTRSSVLMHTIALNGLVQGCSAFYSFKVLPALEDPGYYSDKSIVSRDFVHENIYFTVLATWGSIYYNFQARANLQSHFLGRVIEAIFLFWPYILIRPLFPITRFSNAGTSKLGRTQKNENFYRVGTLMVKFFYLWAKYFLGFFINFAIHLDLLTPDQWKVQHCMYLMNLGTVSISIFLHTLRFKKVLPPKLTFTLYLMQIYATFGALPIVLELFSLHLKLSAVCVAGLLCNMTRNRKIHAVWCACTMLLFYYGNVDW